MNLHHDSTNINIGGSVAARIARQTTNSSTTSTSTSSSSTLVQDDGFGEYRNLCEVRIRRLERYKKAKSFCSLDSDDSINYGNLSVPPSASSSSGPLHSSVSSTCSTAPSESSTSSSASSSTSQSPSHSTHQINTTTTTTRPASSHGSIFESQVELLKQKMVSQLYY